MLKKIINKNKFEIFEKIAVRIDHAKIKGGLFNLVPQLSGIYQQRKIKIILLPAGRNNPATLDVYCYLNCPFKLSIYHEGKILRILKKIGFYREIETGDMEFDKKYFIRTNNGMAARNFLMDYKSKKIIDSFMSSGFNTVCFRKKHINIKKQNYSLDEDLKLDKVLDLLEKLNVLSGKVNYC
ncbi:hypothetical protein KAU39_08085 [bacterium]|nr:hypothetical protein [bacterium]